MRDYKGYLIDLDGTMYRGTEAIAGAAEFINELHLKEIPYLFVTNNSSKTPEDVANKLNAMEIKAAANQIVTSATATANYIKSIKEKASCFVIGEKGLLEALEASGMIITDTECDFVVMGIDRQITYEKFTQACLAIRNGAKLIATNGDVAIPTERGLLPGNGALVSVVSVSTGENPLFIGKPESIIMEEALKLLGLTREETLMVGDNYQTDISAGIRAGIDTLMVFTGVTPFEDLDSLEIPPTYYVHQLTEWLDKI
ncbi:TIGR01457 family HAD-type hydrolase [Oceanobacillus profundus]|uniref:TIGR01457 family HAD-type hydrolase n=1 Tax=Oceanobacillus TaxID=182709 RepID=UPI0026E45098|nr:TIGR01457 family HAD-type hydrolase [Oceanobacillus profundus]MDO6449112.1 TIGR01457 family HAD-type hydrolase [Oceanobacillus profundus]